MDSVFGNIAGFLAPPGTPPAARVAARPPPAALAAASAAALPLPPPRVRAVAFSRNRAFQLRCLLRSLKRARPTEVFVLWRADGDASKRAYALVQAEFQSHRFLCDSDAGPAANLAIALADAEFVWFLVDDALVIEDFDLGAAATALRRDERLLAAHARLCPSVTWCHPQDAPCAPPAVFDVVGVEPAPPNVGAAPELLAFDRTGLSGDWSYAWDLAGGIYRGTDASAVVRDVVGINNDAAAHPNRLEANGNAALRRLGLTARRPRSACPAGKKLVVVTINRVQDVYSAPVYATPAAPSLDALDALVDDAAADLDAAMYAKTSHDSAHVGEWFPVHRPPPAPLPRVSVLIAAKNEKATIVDAVRSALDEGDIVEEVVVIDDHSTDGTRAALMKLAEADARVRVLESPGHGLASALNFGLQMCSCDVVARLDADDVFAAGQLGRHVARFADLRRRGHVAVLGGATVSFWPDGARTPLLRTRDADPEWSLLFACSVAHPTVLLDRRAVLKLDGYATAAEPAEDYDLWLRAADAGAGVANASDIPRTWLRKRSTSVSSARRAAQEAAADAAVARSIGRRLGGAEPPLAAVAALRRPASSCGADLDAAAVLLSSLRARAVAAAADARSARRIDTVAAADDARATKRIETDASQRLAELQACALRLGRVLGVADGKMEALRGLCAAAAACKVSSVGDASAAES